ncbi:MAG: right-handed parallel beta-helix repeat-containing protein [Planctomycetota bacterium]
MRRFVFAFVLFGICGVASGATVNVTGLVSDDEGAASGNVTAIRNAIAAAGNGGTCIFPAGVYYVDATIAFDVAGTVYNDVTFDGYGTALRRISTGTDPFLILLPGSGWSILGMTIDGNRGSDVPNWSWGISCNYSRSRILIKDCTVKNVPYDGINISNESGNVTIEDCNIVDNHRQGIAFVDTIGGGVVKNCYFNNNAYQGLDIEPDGHNTSVFEVSGCIFDGDDNLNIWGASYGSADIDVTDCNFINGADLIGNRLTGELRTSDNTFESGSGVIFNSYNDNTEGTGKITLTANSFADVTNNGIDLITNGGFESWTGGNPDGWSIVGGGTVEETDVNDALAGASALHIVNVSGTTEVQQTISATAESFYTYGYYVNRTSGQLWMKVEFLNGSSSVLETQKLLALAIGEYEKVMGITKAPVGTASIRISIGKDSGFDAMVDEVFMFEGIGPDGGDLTDIDDGIIESYLFDFDDNRSGASSPLYYPYLTAPGYVSVLPTTIYDPNVGYGFSGDGTYSPISDSTNVGYDPLYRDAILCNLANDYFRVDVPDGLYEVTVAIGSPGYSRWVKCSINGVDYHWAYNPPPPYDVEPNDGSVKVIDALPRPHVITDVQGNSDRGGSYDQIRVVGWAEGNPAIGYKSEFLYIDRTVVNVAGGNGHIDIAMTATTDNRFIAMAKIDRIAPTTCEQVKAMGLLSTGDISEDCYVNLEDVALFAENWLLCNDPTDSNCIETW